MAMTPRTKQNLNVAMLNKALANAKYLRFASCARMNQHPELASVFQMIADIDRTDHFRKEFDLAGVCSDDIANLKAAIQDKGYQMDMYCRFATQARADSDMVAAELFDRVRAEAFHELTAFEAALENIEREAQKKCVAA